MYRISQNGQEPIIDVDQVEATEPAIRSDKPDRSAEISRDPLASGHTSRRWGAGIKRDDGSVAIEHDPWLDSCQVTNGRQPFVLAI